MKGIAMLLAAFVPLAFTSCAKKPSRRRTRGRPGSRVKSTTPTKRAEPAKPKPAPAATEPAPVEPEPAPVATKPAAVEPEPAPVAAKPVPVVANAEDLDKAIRAGDFTEYFADISTWLDKKTPAGVSGISEAAMTRLLEGPVFANTLAQRQLISKVGVNNMGSFARGGEKNRTFLAWLLRNTDAMDLYLKGATPTVIKHREANSWRLPVSSLDIWNRISRADPSSRRGIFLRLAIAVGLNPPGTGNRGAGQAATPADPVDRYRHFKSAHEKGELFPRFGGLTVWEYRQIVSTNASNADLVWGREMLNTWRPDLRVGERVVLTTSQVWRRNSPIPFNNTFKNVLAGGGKCGPRSSWSVFICQAFGIPAVGVRQPGHVCVAYKSLDGWKIAYGRGWHVSRVQGGTGPEFLEGIDARSRAAQFSQVEHLRWLASALTSKERAAAVMEVARKIARAKPAAKVDLTASEKAEEAESDPGAHSKRSKPAPSKAASAPAAKPEAPFKVAPGAVHVEAESFTRMGGRISYQGLQKPGVEVHDCYTGGKQIYFPSHMQSSWVDYAIDVPETGTYGLVMRVAVVNREQVLSVTDISSVCSVKKATASNVYRGRVAQSGPARATDGNSETRWATDVANGQAWLEVDLGEPTEVGRVVVEERSWNRVRKFQLQYKVRDTWRTILEGTTLGKKFVKEFGPVRAQYFRLNILEATAAPTIHEFQLSGGKQEPVSVKIPNTYGLWATTPEVEMKLERGPRKLRVSTGFQRGVALRWFELRSKRRNR